jgi:hypothetical protein
MPPFSGAVQVAESSRARAVSFNGLQWEFQYFGGDPGVERVRGYGLDRGFFKVAKLDGQELHTFNFPAYVDHDTVSASIVELHEFLQTATIPFPFGDQFEYWLLDGTDGSPLALIYACCDESLKARYPSRAEWTALPHSKMRVENTDHEVASGEPPVNHRLQQAIATRAGYNPKAAWFDRSRDNGTDFPDLMIREDWQDEANHDLCQRYLMRKAPRLLMLQGLSADDRDRLELAAKQHVFEVEDYYALYPEIVDEKRMSAMRVEARLRRDMPKVAAKGKVQESAGPERLSKDMRIIEN